MAVIVPERFNALLNHRRADSVSLYLPTHRSGMDSRQDPIRLKNLVRDAEDQLAKRDVGRARIERITAPVWAKQNDDDFWRHQLEGLAVFLDDVEPLFFRLPATVDEMAVVSDRFHLLPFFFMNGLDQRFWLLAFSQSLVKLYAAGRFDIESVELPADVPKDFDEAMKLVEVEKHIEFHSGTSEAGMAGGPARGHSGAARRPAIFHGQGIGGDDAVEKMRLLEYCQKVNVGVARRLAGQKDPLIIAAAEPLGAIYAEANTYANLVDVRVRGNPDHVQARDLHAQAVAQLEPLFRLDVERAKHNYTRLARRGRATCDLRQVLLAALDGQVETLFVARNYHPWGRFDPERRSEELHNERLGGDEHLGNTAAIHTRLRGGDVFILDPEDMPQDASIAAALRFAT